MQNIIGRQIEIGVGLELTRGTPVGLIKSLKKVTADVLPRADRVIDDNTMAVLEESEGSRITKKWFDGDVEGAVHADSIGYMLLSLYGSVSSVPSGNAFEHSFSFEQSIEHPTISIYRKDGDILEEVYGGGVINTLEITAKPEDLVRFKANVICANKATSNEAFSYDKEYDFVGRDVSIKLASTEAGLVGATAIKVKESVIKYNSNAIKDHNLGSYNPDIYNSAFSLDIDITKNFVDETFKDMFEDQDYSYMQVTIESEADIATGKKAKIVLLLNKVQVQNWAVSGNANDLVVEKMTFKAFYNMTDGEQSTLKLQNLTDSYVLAS